MPILCKHGFGAVVEVKVKKELQREWVYFKPTVKIPNKDILVALITQGMLPIMERILGYLHLHDGYARRVVVLRTTKVGSVIDTVASGRKSAAELEFQNLADLEDQTEEDDDAVNGY